MRAYQKRLLRLFAGLAVCALGIYLSIQANVGLAPWDAFQMGIANQTKLSYGDVSILVSLLVVVADLVLGEKVGIGTIINAIVIGKLVDLAGRLDIVHKMTAAAPGMTLLVVSQIILSVGTWLYMSAGFGCGPRDTLMVALGRRYPHAPIGLVRGAIDGTVLLIGWLLGAKVGLGTVFCVFGMGFILQQTFRQVRFDAKAVQHEGVTDTVKLVAAQFAQ